MNEKRISRRQLLRRTLKCSAAAGLFTIVPRHVLGGPGYTPPSEQLTKGVIGVGSMGRTHLSYGPSRLLAICDVDEQHLEGAALHLRENLGLAERQVREIRRYRDFRELLAQPDIDIVHIATPPHWHALIAIAAARAGKDIWCEKPMTRTIGEGRAVVEAVRRHGRVFRVNTWFRFTDPFYAFGSRCQPIKQLVDSGLLGWPLTVTVGLATGFSWKFLWQGRTDLTPQPVPVHLDYDLWLGPAPFKPYHPHRVHETFRGYWDYDGGGLGDMGQHYLDPVQFLLGKDDESPVRVEADAPQQHPDAVGIFRRIEMTYADGCRIILDGSESETRTPYIEGPNGRLYRGFECDVPGWREVLATRPDPAPQRDDFEQAVRERRKFALNEANAHRSCTLVNLAKAAVYLGRPLRFDPVRQEFIDDPAANRLINPPMRAPWHL
ncbi:MAG TPA: Gfo/Idh/MocA family oxidoreductase [Candidatus Sumerlaeota bacterium]|nr:MAG: Inositol 2-dehydrogenase [candidate division BRC1 bacterium ADurb.BinA292]HOE95528.1 Gfo/Idh/MocA family oxidoreductase [Candidatus Sumerlaeota bacterium]HOR27147.1 Gfo/Idh/MocA family oxidoreductase [Candidatus Sumerlaeota bacterium]HPK01636.1 Gfo/Idh/MocA family oxidoreductase [Candidatus Sumerlaeota bacterium]